MPQFEELMEALDNRYFEADLCQTIEFEKAEIERQMELTEKLTNDLKPSLSKKSYLELENQTIVKAQEERQEAQLQEERERREAEEAVDQQLKEAEEAKKKAEEEEKAKKEEEKRREREERLRKREESRGDSFPDLGEDEIKKEDIDIKEEEVPMETSEEVITTEGEIKEENSEPNKVRSSDGLCTRVLRFGSALKKWVYIMMLQTANIQSSKVFILSIIIMPLVENYLQSLIFINGPVSERIRNVLFFVTHI